MNSYKEQSTTVLLKQPAGEATPRSRPISTAAVARIKQRIADIDREVDHLRAEQNGLESAIDLANGST